MYKRTIFLTLIALLVGGTTAFAASRPLEIPVGGNFVDALGGNGAFTGHFAVTEFAVDNGQLVARGFISGILTDSTGKVVGSAMRDVAIPVKVTSGDVSSAQGTVSLSVGALATCPILHLDLGPLHLNLLGLHVDLSEVVLDITAQSGPGNLLGNLLCAITNLLNGGGSLTTLANLLNQILQALVNLLG